MSRGAHTIVLLQPNGTRSSRTFNDYPSISLALDGIALMFEQKLKNELRNSRNITYDISELHHFIDVLDDLVCLVFNERTMSYDPRDKQWIKHELTLHFKRQANRY